MDTAKLSTLAVSDTGFIFDPATGHSYTTNEVGIRLLKLLKDGLDKNQLTSQIIAEYDVSEDEIDLDYNEFVDNLKANFLI